MSKLSKVEAEALYTLQRGIPLVARPFEAVGAECGMSGGEVVALVERLLASGDARRFGGVFDARRMGYRSALCAMSVHDESELQRVLPHIVAEGGVTHAYERGWPAELAVDSAGGPAGRRWPNLWFTLAAPSESFDADMAELRRVCEPIEIFEMPAVKRFKIDVVFDLRTCERDERVEPRRNQPGAEAGEVFILSEAQRAIVRRLQGHLAVSERPFAEPAADLGMSDEEELLEQLQGWHKCGVLRRIGVLLRHRKMGFKANGMCCWDVPLGGDATEIGRKIAAFPQVTHCYERPWFEEFPFRLYAMIHTQAWEDTQALFERIGSSVGLCDGQLLLSLREFKKTSMQFFPVK